MTLGLALSRSRFLRCQWNSYVKLRTVFIPRRKFSSQLSVVSINLLFFTVQFVF